MADDTVTPQEEIHQTIDTSKPKSIQYNESVVLITQLAEMLHKIAATYDDSIKIDGIDNTDPANPVQNTMKSIPSLIRDFTEEVTGYLARAKTSETNAKTSETNSKTSETNAKTSERNSKTSETNAKTSERNSKTSETNAKVSETNAHRDADLSKGYKNEVAGSEGRIKGIETKIQDLYNSFTRTYHGASDTEPTDHLTVGDLWFDISKKDDGSNKPKNELKIYEELPNQPGVFGWRVVSASEDLVKHDYYLRAQVDPVHLALLTDDMEEVLNKNDLYFNQLLDVA